MTGHDLIWAVWLVAVGIVAWLRGDEHGRAAVRDEWMRSEGRYQCQYLSCGLRFADYEEFRVHRHKKVASR